MITGAMDQKGGAHTERYCSEAVWIVFWKNHVAATRETADRAELQVFAPGLGRTMLMDFAMPDRERALDQAVESYQRVFEFGKQARSKEFAALMNGGPGLRVVGSDGK